MEDILQFIREFEPFMAQKLSFLTQALLSSLAVRNAYGIVIRYSSFAHNNLLNDVFILPQGRPYLFPLNRLRS